VATGRARSILTIAAIVALAAAAAGLGALAAQRPTAAALLVGGALVVSVALLWPMAALAALLAITTLVPFSIQNRFGVASGPDDPGLLIIDVLLILSLCRVAVRFLHRRWDGPMIVGALLLLLLAAQVLHGLLNGWPANDAGTEVRRMVLAVGALLLSLHLLEHEATGRRLPAVLVLLGLVAGAWGLAQWYLESSSSGRSI
jgi:hypothetical protein